VKPDKKIFNPLFAAGYFKQLVVERDIPVPVKPGFCKCFVERLAVRVFGVRHCAVYVENNSFDCHGCL
jgi:hypothetical protein